MRAGNLPQLKQLLGSLQLSYDEMTGVLWEAYNSRCWAAVQAVQHRWSPVLHGDLAQYLSTCAVYYRNTCACGFGLRWLVESITRPSCMHVAMLPPPLPVGLLQEHNNRCMCRTFTGSPSSIRSCWGAPAPAAGAPPSTCCSTLSRGAWAAWACPTWCP